MSSDISSYLASRYLVADPGPNSKKRKRKQAAKASGLLIQDDDEASWGTARSKRDENVDGESFTVSGTSADFRKAKINNWKAVGASSSQQRPNDDASAAAAAADDILASAAAEKDATRADDDEMPIVEGDVSGVVRMSDGTHAGLQSAASVSAQLKRRQREEREEFERSGKSSKEQETVYRDATGRRIDISMRRAEARRAAAEAEEQALEKERLAKESLKGQVQQDEARRRREKLDDAKLMGFARTADDEEMNEELKQQQRWNDPMMQFVSGDQESGKGGGKALSSKKNKRPIYAGAAPPNRYGIRPGYRWDGVDRGTGFEAERFKALNRRERNKALDYSWQMDE